MADTTGAQGGSRSDHVRLGVAFAALIMMCVAACDRQEPGDRGQAAPAASVEAGKIAVQAESVPEPAPIPPVQYRRRFIPGFPTVKVLRDSLGKAGFQQVLKINRIDNDHVRRDDALIIPGGLLEAGTLDDPLFASPFPRTLAAAVDLPKLVVISIRVQAFAAYDRGRLVRWGPVSTGRKLKPTPVGLYHVNWKDEDRTSTIDEEWQLKWCLNIDSLLGVSLHQYALPGWPASHSCVRLGQEDACWLYDWAEEWTLSADGLTILQPGTPVLIFGEWKGRPPWKDLCETPEATTVSVAEIEAALVGKALASGQNR
jgi:hypothetical protein